MCSSKACVADVCCNTHASDVVIALRCVLLHVVIRVVHNDNGVARWPVDHPGQCGRHGAGADYTGSTRPCVSAPPDVECAEHDDVAVLWEEGGGVV